MKNEDNKESNDFMPTAYSRMLIHLKNALHDGLFKANNSHR